MEESSMPESKWLGILSASLLNLLQHKLRSILSILGIVCGTMAVLAMISIGEGARKKVVEQIEQLGIRNIFVKNVTLSETRKARARERLSPGLNPGDVERILAGCEWIHDAAALREVAASVFGSAPDASPPILEVSSGYARLMNLPVLRGRFIADPDSRRKNPICVLGARVAETFGSEGGVGNSIRIEDRLFRIVGILGRSRFESEENPTISARNYDSLIFVPLDILNPGKSLTEIVIQVEKTEQVMPAGEMVSRIMEVAHNRVEDYQIVIPRELLRQARRAQRTLNLVLSAIAGISLLVGGIGIMNVMLAAVSERTREIGIRRAVGASRSEIVFQFLSESVLLAGTGGILGILIGSAVVRILSRFGEWETAITFPAVVLPLLMSFTTGVFFGIYPAWLGARMDPAAALRQ
jgi:putative ABC transport system permease protein